MHGDAMTPTNFSKIYSYMWTEVMESREHVVVWNDGYEKRAKLLVEYIQMLSDRASKTLKSFL